MIRKVMFALRDILLDGEDWELKGVGGKGVVKARRCLELSWA